MDKPMSLVPRCLARREHSDNLLLGPFRSVGVGDKQETALPSRPSVCHRASPATMLARALRPEHLVKMIGAEHALRPA